MSKNNSIKIEPEESEYVEYRVRGYLVQGNIPIRPNMKPSSRYYAGKHDENRFFKYVASYLLQSDPKPHAIKLENCPAITVSAVTRTKLTSLEDESRLRNHKIRRARFGERKTRKGTQKAVKSAFSLYMDRPFEP
jgi:hypothetical protein